MLARTRPKGLMMTIMLVCFYIVLLKLNSTDTMANSINSMTRGEGDNWYKLSELILIVSLISNEHINLKLMSKEQFFIKAAKMKIFNAMKRINTQLCYKLANHLASLCWYWTYHWQGWFLWWSLANCTTRAALNPLA